MEQQSSVRGNTSLPTQTLGKKRETPFTYTPELLEAIPLTLERDVSQHGEQHMWVTNNCLRFTSLCPVTGQPDWADITINYIPKDHIVESKSLKEYLGSFRMHGDFHEDVCRIICDDIVNCIKPQYIEIVGSFDSRGSISIWPFVQYAEKGNELTNETLKTRLMNYAPNKYRGDMIK